MSSESNPWRVYYVFEATSTVREITNRVIFRSDIMDNLYLTMRWFGDNSGIGRYRLMDTDPNSPTAGQHLFERGSVKLSIIPVKEKFK